MARSPSSSGDRPALAENRGRVSAIVVPVLVPSSRVARVLPAGLGLGQSPFHRVDARGEALHPIFFMFAPSDRYVLAQPGAMSARMGPGESGVRDLVLAGDWTRTHLGCGCVEAATYSGMLAARTIAGCPVHLWHPGF